MKEITIRYNTYDKYHNSWRGEQHLEALIDGMPIDNLKSFSMKFDATDIEPTFTLEQYMDYPEDDEYNW